MSIQRLRLPFIFRLRLYFDDSSTSVPVHLSLVDCFHVFLAKNMQRKVKMATPAGSFSQQNGTLAGLDEKKMVAMRLWLPTTPGPPFLYKHVVSFWFPLWDWKWQTGRVVFFIILARMYLGIQKSVEPLTKIGGSQLFIYDFVHFGHPEARDKP